MKIRFLLGILLLAAGSTFAARPEVTGLQADKMIAGAQRVIPGSHGDIPDYVEFRPDARIAPEQFSSWAHAAFRLPAEYDFVLLHADIDAIGMTHYRYQQTVNGVPLEGSMLIVHVSHGRVVSVNGSLFKDLPAARAVTLDEASALNKALAYMHAARYRWESPQMENLLKQTTGDPAATWYPKGTQVMAPVGGNFSAENYRLTWRFDIYADEPARREYVFVDAASGEVIYTVNRIRTANATATAVTRYSGNRTIITDSVNATTYRLRETGRGLGIETYNSQTTTNHPTVDFLDTDNIWNNVNAAQDEVATDAHWGAEVTYDFYWTKFARSSVDNAGQKLLSFVHYSTNLVNANWDGTEMNYGDGNQSQGYGPLTCLDVAGHEISHGVTEHTSNLNYQDESGAMNESFSDCMGNSIRQFGKNNATINWLIGDEMGGTPFRSMSNPNQYGDPDTYNGTNWYTGPNDNGGVHTNSGVMNYWFYLLTMGGNGTNDIGSVYSVVGLGLDTAAAICYRMNAVYLVPTSQYADARTYAIQAAIDLYGPCTNAVIQTTNAWYAVGVGAAFSPVVTSNFMAPQSVYCTAPAVVNFTNQSFNAGTYTWDFGDGSPVSNVFNPVHTYTSYGQYTVSLIADGGSCGSDTLVRTQYINVDTLNPCVVWMPANGTGPVQTTCTGFLYDNGGPSGNYTDQADVTITIAPAGAASVTLNFTLFDLEDNFDYLYIYDGPTTASPQFGSFTGNTLPWGGTITSSGGAITLRMTSDQALNMAGFALSWQCTLSTVPPVAAFTASDTVTCSGTVQFTDHSTQGPTSWAWDFGDGGTDTQQHPTHTYTTNGTYSVTLVATNGNGSDTLMQTNYITVNLPAAPVSSDDSVCAGSDAQLFASGGSLLTWYDAPVGGARLDTGAVLNISAAAATSTYYVATEIFPPAQMAGPATNGIGAGGNFNNTNFRSLVFNCFMPVKLVSVLVYAQGAGNRTIELVQGGTTIQSVTVNIPAGTSRVTLNFDLPVANGLELGIQGNINLYRNSAGASFPYTLNGVVSITGNNAFDQARYYFFYDWELQAPPCTSPRTPVTLRVDADPASAFSFAAAVDTVTFTDLSTDATSWMWDFGDPASGALNTSTLQHPVHIYSGNGTYTACLVTANGRCSDTLCMTVPVTGVGIRGPEAFSSLRVYPNPVQEELLIDAGGVVRASDWQATLTDVSGRVAAVKTLPQSAAPAVVRWNVASLAPGVYFITLEGSGQKMVRKFVKE